MHPLVNHIIQLQELTLVRDEQKAVSEGAHLQQLNESIATMVRKLPKDTKLVFEKLHQRDHNVIVPMTEGNCSVCGMQLPSSLIQLIRLGGTLENCPNCSRILYEPASHPKHVGRKRKRYEPKQVGISRFSSEALMIPSLAATDKDGVVTELAALMEERGFVDNGERLAEEALRREAVCSTSLGHELAFPHVRAVEGGGGLTLALGLCKDGIPFDGIRGETSKLIFFMVIPTAASAFYLKILAGLAETFQNAEARETILACDSKEKLWKALLKVTRKTIK